MKTVNKLRASLIFLVLLLPGVFLLFYVNAQQKLLSSGLLKCDGYTEFNTTENGMPITYHLLQDFRIDKNRESMIIFHGIRKDKDDNFRIERKVIMSKAETYDEDTVVMNVKRVEKTVNDNISDEAFSHYLADLGDISNTLRLDIVSLNNGTYLIGNSTAFNFACVSY